MATATQIKTARACRLLGEAKALEKLAKEKAKEAKALVAELLPEGEKGALASRAYGTITRTYQDRLGIDPSAEDALRERLGDQFADFVTVSTALKPTKKLKELLSSGDSVVGSKVRPLVEVKHTPMVKFTAAPGIDFADLAADGIRKEREQTATKVEEAA